MSLLKCPHCPRRFDSIAELREHVRETHETGREAAA
jgi:uncharacterized C2H2 Zn-finger protein